MRTPILLASGLIALISCSRNFQEPPPKIPEDRFASYYASALVITQEGKLFKYDTLVTKRRIDSLQRSFSFSNADVEQTLHFYHNDLTKWKELNLKVIKNIEAMQKKND